MLDVTAYRDSIRDVVLDMANYYRRSFDNDPLTDDEFSRLTSSPRTHVGKGQITYRYRIPQANEVENGCTIELIHVTADDTRFVNLDEYNKALPESMEITTLTDIDYVKYPSVPEDYDADTEPEDDDDAIKTKSRVITKTRPYPKHPVYAEPTAETNFEYIKRFLGVTDDSVLLTHLETPIGNLELFLPFLFAGERNDFLLLMVRDEINPTLGTARFYLSEKGELELMYVDTNTEVPPKDIDPNMSLGNFIDWLNELIEKENQSTPIQAVANPEPLQASYVQNVLSTNVKVFRHG